MLGVHFGAGNIGRGFIGQLLHGSGYDVCFVDVREDVVDALKAEGRYEVVMADEAGEHICVDRVTALHSEHEAEEVARRLAEADLATTAVGPSVLDALGPIIARGLVERVRRGGTPVNVIACENMIGGSETLRGFVMEHVSPEYLESAGEISGFPNAAVDRIVPEQDDEDDEGVDVLVEPFFEWVVEAPQVKGDRPDITGVTYTEDSVPYLERKLLTLNTAHSAAAYLGYACGKPTVYDALEEERVRETTSETLEETGRLLIEEYAFDPEEHREYTNKVLARLRNPRILDDVSRVARSPIRKLGGDERFVSPALRLLELGHKPVHLATVIGLVLRYDHPEDEEAVELQETIRAVGERSALVRYAGVEEGHPLVDLVVERLDRA